MTDYHVKASATGGGDGSSSNPWTLQEAYDNGTNNFDDRVIVWADAQYNLTTSIDLDTVGKLTLVGANSSGVIDGTKPVFDGGSLPASTSGFVISTTAAFDDFNFLNIRFQNFSYRAVSLGDYRNTRVWFGNCEFFDCGDALSQGSFVTLTECRFGNCDAGLAAVANRATYVTAIACVFEDCLEGLGGGGAYLYAINNLFYRCRISINCIESYGDLLVAVNNTIHGDGSVGSIGILIPENMDDLRTPGQYNGSTPLIFNNLIDNVETGFQCTGTVHNHAEAVLFPTKGNVLGDNVTDVAGGFTFSNCFDSTNSTDIVVDFENTATGSEDFSLKTTSAALGKGYPMPSS